MRTLFLAIALLTAMYSGIADNYQVIANQVMDSYINISESLIKGDEKQQFQLIATSSALANERKEIIDLVKVVNKSIAQINSVSKIDIRREELALLTKDLILFFKNHKVLKYDLFIQYCPMKKANWLSKSISIRNPFYGKIMLTCGNNQGKIEGVK